RCNIGRGSLKHSIKHVLLPLHSFQVTLPHFIHLQTACNQVKRAILTFKIVKQQLFRKSNFHSGGNWGKCAERLPLQAKCRYSAIVEISKCSKRVQEWPYLQISKTKSFKNASRPIRTTLILSS